VPPDTALAFYNEFWAPACHAVTALEARGIAFDSAAARQGADRAAADLAALEEKWATLSGGINPRSPRQLQELFYTRRKFPVPPVTGTLKAVKRTKRGEWPTGEAALDWLHKRARMPENVELLATLMEYRKVDQLNRFLVGLPEYVCSDGRLRGSFSADKSTDDNSGGTRTGRLASRNPNLQNIPGAQADRYGIRACFVAPPGKQLLVADYTALELYIMADWMIRVLGDSSLLDALLSGDVYAAVAKRTWPDRLEGIEAGQLKEHPDKEVRRIRSEAKIIVLSSNYLKSVGGLALQLGCTEDVAQEHADAYARAFPGIPAMQRWAADYARKHGGVHTLAGRFRALPDIHDPREWVAAKAERQAINTIVQGSAAEVVFGAMIGAEQAGYATVLQCHDEMVAEVGSEPAEPFIGAMTNPYGMRLRVPLKVAWKVCSNWSEGK
jgi:DNA polymerase-1